MALYKRPYKRKSLKKPLKKRSVKKTTFKKSVTAIVKQAMSRKAENKEVCATNQYMKIYQSGSNTITASTVNNLSPTIVQSVNENGRIGNSVTVKSMMLRGYLSVMPQNALGIITDSSVPEQIGQWNVRLFIGKLKASINAPTTADFQQLLRTGAVVSEFASQNSLSLVRGVNTELFSTYYDKIFKIGMQNGSNASTLTGIHNNDYKLSRLIKINCTKMFKKTLVFNDNNNTPTNCGLYMWAGLVDSLGSALTTNDPLVQLSYDLEYSYEDM